MGINKLQALQVSLIGSLPDHLEMCKYETFSLGIGCFLVSLICFGIDRNGTIKKKKKLKKYIFFSFLCGLYFLV